MNGLSKAHFVSKNAVEMVVVERDEPLEAMELIVFEFSALEDGGLFGDFFLDGVCEVIVDRV